MARVACKEELRERLLDAAEHLLTRYGYKKMTMDDLAEETGVGKGTIYLYFESKEALALGVVDRYNVRLRAALREIAQSEGTPTHRLREMILTRIMLRAEQCNKKSSKVIEELVAALRMPYFCQMRDSRMEAEADVFLDVLIEGRLKGEFFFENARETAMTMLWATHGLMPFSLTMQDFADLDTLRKRISNVADLILKSLHCEDSKKS